jgi:hypothetical protein
MALVASLDEGAPLGNGEVVDIEGTTFGAIHRQKGVVVNAMVLRGNVPRV